MKSPSLTRSPEAPPVGDVGSKESYQPQPYVKLSHPQWSRQAAIYQVNTRQFTQEGTLRAAQAHLPRLKELGVDIIWLMPIHPIGVEHRKGSLGSPYSVSDYFEVNPELGTLDDLRDFVSESHRLGLYVILDWVANHTSRDNALRRQHPTWYKKDYKGDFQSTPWWDWTDVIDLDYRQPELRKYMIEAMKYWVRTADVDGFRCDVAGFVPVDFWNSARRELDEIKPVFMLAEWESRDLHAEAFDMTYAWTWWDAVYDVVNGLSDLEPLFTYYSWNESAFPREAYRMTFVSNHDKNAWEGTQFESFGPGLEAAIVLSVIGTGMPLIYCGQEAGNPRRLAFFERDPIDWRPHPIGDLYQTLIALKKKYSVLWNGEWGASMIRVPNSAPRRVLSFVRQNASDKIFAVVNFSARRRAVSFSEPLFEDRYLDVFSGDEVEVDARTKLRLDPWAYRVFARDDSH